MFLTWKRLAVVAALATAAPLASATVLPLGSWQTFSFGTAPSFIDTYTIDVAPGSHVKVKIVDGFVIGDEFSYSVDGGALQFTSDADANDGIQSNAFDGDAAWADARLSKALILLLPGSHTIDIAITENALGTSGGGAFIRADLPEPATLGMIGLVLAGLGFSRRKIA
ncbi:MAG TPA: PEP-CTERM sorting domain-containing protein [Candidatus Accumulibacter phosphatis]|uniref:PEP-CTERM sorting domain-containing protein n=1 Tax=Accumulibacter sp. TaxID=2053492 RepID=UPI001A507847|nr:PEP-CTERM sorting domain-containing protein [Accumulibacter sp.]MBL8408275.1 PEP-CTERM sorting domain-containing protein [Accumulibacter sp.]HRF12892.1 PEP-CTERM sorting domain-containing protein [Candidatus Accumulibacter phosphatis]